MVHTKKAEMEGIAEIDCGTEKGYDLGIQLGPGKLKIKGEQLCSQLHTHGVPVFEVSTYCAIGSFSLKQRKVGRCDEKRI